MLTLEEKKYVIINVLNQKNRTITEAINNHNLKNDILLNINFYSGLKEQLYKQNRFLKEDVEASSSILKGIIHIFGNIKDLFTSTDIGKWISSKIKKYAEKSFPHLSAKEDITDKIADFFKSITKWLGVKGIAFIIAWFKKLKRPGKGFIKSLRKPTEEEIEASMGAATTVYKVLLGILIAVAVFKLCVFLAAAGPATLGVIGASVGAKGGIMAIVKGIITKVLTKTGLTKVGLAAFNSIGLVSKVQHFQHAGHDDHEPEKYQTPKSKDLNKSNPNRDKNISKKGKGFINRLKIREDDQSIDSHTKAEAEEIKKAAEEFLSKASDNINAEVK